MYISIYIYMYICIYFQANQKRKTHNDGDLVSPQKEKEEFTLEGETFDALIDQLAKMKKMLKPLTGKAEGFKDGGMIQGRKP